MALSVPLPAATHPACNESPEPAAEPAPSRAPPRSRWRPWLWLLALLIAARWLLSISLAPLVEARLSRVLGTRVDVGGVSFEPIDAVLTLRNVVVHAPV